MRHIPGILLIISALSLAAAFGASPAAAASSTCYYLSASVPPGFFDGDLVWSPGIAYAYVSWPGTASEYPQISTRVTSASIGVLAASWVEYYVAGSGALIVIANASPIGGTAYFEVCFS